MYGREALRRLREQQREAARQPERAPALLAQVPRNAPMDDATITAWNGERFVRFDKWRATAPVMTEETAEASAPAIPIGTKSVFGDCAGTRVWLVREGERWLMFTGSFSPGGRRRNFASPFLSHAIRTAQQWYGSPASGWHASAVQAASNGQ